MDFHVFPLIFMDLRGSGTRMSAARWHTVPPCGGLSSPVAPDWIPLVLRFQILEAWIWSPGAWMPGCKDWRGLEEVTEAAEGMGMGGCWMGGEDWKDVSHARARGARRMTEKTLLRERSSQSLLEANRGEFEGGVLGKPRGTLRI